MANTPLVGTAGGFTAAGFVCKFLSFRATLEGREFNTTGFGDKGWLTSQIINGRVVGDALGVITDDKPAPDAALAVIFAGAEMEAAVLLTADAGNTWGFTAQITAVELERAEEGANSSVYRIRFVSTGQVVQTWS